MNRAANGYRQMVTTDGRFVPGAIIGFAHRRARDEFDAHVHAVGARDNPFTYRELLARELTNAWGWAFAIRDAGQGEAPVAAVPMFRDAIAA